MKILNLVAIFSVMLSCSFSPAYTNDDLTGLWKTTEKYCSTSPSTPLLGDESGYNSFYPNGSYIYSGTYNAGSCRWNESGSFNVTDLVFKMSNGALYDGLCNGVTEIGAMTERTFSIEMLDSATLKWSGYDCDGGAGIMTWIAKRVP